jgi:uncharacterized repeat protein (TIGR01451 family)
MFGFSTTGGNPLAPSFSLGSGGITMTSNLRAGTYTVTENDPTPAYDLTGLSCAASGSGTSASTSLGTRTATINIGGDAQVDCVYTNTQRSTLKVMKVTNPANDATTTFTFTTGGGLTPPSFTLMNGGIQTFANLPPGSGYTVAETALAGWDLTSSSCSNGSPVANISLSAGQIVTCTFQNTARGEIKAIKSGALYMDADQNGVTSPGDTLLYSVHITNVGHVPVQSVVYSDTLDPNTNLVVGSVTTTLGSVTSGNNPGDTAVHVSIGTVSVGETVVISYQAIITKPIPPGVTVIRNQGFVSSTTVTDTVPTCDPGNPICGPTITSVNPTTPTLQLSVDSNVPQCTLPGATYNLTWTVVNLSSGSFGGGVLDTVATGSGSVPPTATVPGLAGNSSETITQTVQVSQPVAYGAETVTVTASILSATASLPTHICAPDFRNSTAAVVGSPVFAHEELTYTWIIRNTGDGPALGALAVLTVTSNPQFTFDDSLTSTMGSASWNSATHEVTWTGDLAVGQTVTVTFLAQSVFGLPHVLLEAPFQVNHPYRPPFDGIATYIYPYKLFIMLVLRGATP